MNDQETKQEKRDCEHCRNYVWDDRLEVWSCCQWNCIFVPDPEQKEES